jgi:nucleoid-associated protein EbfC
MRRSFKAKKQKKQNPNNMLSQMQEMQQEMAEIQKQLEEETITVSSGGGAVTVVITGHQRVQAIEVASELINPEDQEMLQDMLVAAVNAAVEQSQALAAERMEGVTGGMGGGLQDMLGGLGL